ncbi:MAG: hypothetical protein WC755_00690 [Candidatus Woesearchaeota archaeon]
MNIKQLGLVGLMAFTYLSTPVDAKLVHRVVQDKDTVCIDRGKPTNLKNNYEDTFFLNLIKEYKSNLSNLLGVRYSDIASKLLDYGTIIKPEYSYHGQFYEYLPQHNKVAVSGIATLVWKDKDISNLEILFKYVLNLRDTANISKIKFQILEKKSEKTNAIRVKVDLDKKYGKLLNELEKQREMDAKEPNLLFDSQIDKNGDINLF